MELVRVSIDKLRPYPNNPRYNDDAAVAVVASIEEVGYITPIIVDENYQILAGHTRWMALNQMGEEEIDVIVKSGLTEEQKRKFRLLDNKTGELAEWDLDKLQKELDGLDFGDFDFWSKEIEKMGDKILKEHETKSEEEIVICPRCGKVISGLVGAEYLED